MARPKLVSTQAAEPEFQIERGVPLPPSRGGGSLKYPWAEMLVGDSFFVPNHDQPAVSTITKNPSRKYGHKYTTRKVDGGVRVWRIA